MSSSDSSASVNAPRVGVLALQGDVAEHVHALTQVGAMPVLVRRLSELDSVHGLILPGGESTTIDKLLRIFELFEPLRAKIAAGFPVYGSCAGLILLANTLLDPRAGQQTLGGLDVTVRRNAFGRQVDSFECDLSVAELTDPGRPVRTVFIRAPWIEAVGPRVSVLARVPVSAQKAAQASEEAEIGLQTGKIVAVRQGNILATSFHPEVTDDVRVHELFVNMVRASEFSH